MIKLQVLIILIYNLFYFCNCGTLPASQLAEQTLITTLLNGYNKNIRPEDQVSVDITATLLQIIGIDEKQQIMTSSTFISQTWFDDRLSWAPNASNNTIEVVMLPVKSLWIPDTMILNSADASGYLTVGDYSLASVYYTGQVYMILPALTIRTRCNFNVGMFPFDKQMCSINLTSWSQGENRILYTENDSIVIDTSGYIEHPLWELNGTDMAVIRAGDRAPYEDTYNAVISVQLYFKRKPLFFIMNGIFACLILNCVTLLSFALAFGMQVGLCMTCFMTYSVYSLNFTNLFPQQSQYLMMITLYFMLSIFWTLLSLGWFVLYNYYTTKSEMPKPLYAFCGLLQKVFFCCFPRPKKDEKKYTSIENGDLTKIKAKRKRILLPPIVYVSESTSHPSTSETSAPDKNMETTTSENINETKEEQKPKCNFCNRCNSCQASVDKDKDKGKNKKEIEEKCNALNYFVFICIFLCMFISDLVVWLLMAR